MAMEQWQDAASQQVKLLTNRLNELLSRGLELLRSELGVDLGLKPELIPPWMILLLAGTGLLLLVALWASVCRALFKKRPVVSHADDGIEIKRGVSKPVKTEEPKKKKKKAEKKSQPNGRAIAEPQEEAIVSEERVPHHQPPPPEIKAEKAAEVSNKEKREQRKKDKSSSDGSASPGGGGTPVSVPTEQPKASTAPAPDSQKKKKGVYKRVLSVSSAVTDMAVKVPAQTVAPKTASWTPSREPPLWKAGIEEPQPVNEMPWLSQPRLDDEWSGLNGGSVDTGSDWNAPSEAWGNYEEPTHEPPPALEKPLPEPAKEDGDDEKDKGETTADGTAKTKKKKKKKKKAAEEGGTAGQVTACEKMRHLSGVTFLSVKQRVKDNISQKPPVTQVPLKPNEGEPTAKQNNLPAPTQQKKPEESQAPKPAKKKKARRET
uniref:Metadherin a n=1 Tax=Amphilophus citrinellus TaxID=61819 RepID=A0A3Q0R429_AMPCI